MNLEETRKLKDLIYNIYYNGEDPIKFYEATRLENYMEELYPSDPSKLVGDWISERFPPKAFLNQDLLEKEVGNLKKLYQKVIYYANIPNGSVLKQIIGELKRATEESNTPIN